MNIVHFSSTSLAGAPYIITNTLRNYSNHNVRLVDLKRWGRFPHDIVFEENKEMAVEVANNADIIHLHNYLDYNSQDFYPINFRQLKKQGVAFVRHFHSVPETIAKKMKVPVSSVVNADIPSVVIAQYPEPFYPKAKIVPNIIPTQSELYLPVPVEKTTTDIVYSPSNLSSAWTKRWGTKGAPETIKVLNKLKQNYNCNVKVISGVPFIEMMKEKQTSRIIIDDLVTGSYHLSALEGCSLAKSVLCYLSDRTEKVLKEISGADTVPFINVRLEDAYDVLRHLLNNNSLADEIGANNRAWMESFWREETTVEHFLSLYDDLLDNPTKVKRQKNLRIDNKADRFFAIDLPDHKYNSRKKQNTSKFWLIKIKLVAIFAALKKQIKGKIKSGL